MRDGAAVISNRHQCVINADPGPRRGDGGASYTRRVGKCTFGQNKGTRAGSDEALIWQAPGARDR